MLRRTHWLEQIARLDPATDYERIYRITVTHEFPWDMNQALSLALFRTFAVPSIGRLLDETGEFGCDTQRRWRHPMRSQDFRRIRSYPDGYDVDAFGTFPRGCPVRRGAP